MEFTGERYVPSLEGQIKYEHLHRYALCLEFVAGKDVLDIASGEGYGAALLASAAESVTGVDIDPASVEHARHVYYNPKLNFVVGNCDSVPLPDASFDVVTSFETIEHHDKHQEMLDEIKRLLRPGGTLIISSPNRLTYSDEPGYKNPFHVKELYYDEFYELLQRRFKSIRMFGQRLAAGSFVFPLGTFGAANLNPLQSLTGDANRGTERACTLPSPIYFIAICSDTPANEQTDISSVYLDRADDLWKTLEKERVRDIRVMQDQVSRTEEEIARQSKTYEAEMARLTAAMNEARKGYEAQILGQIEELHQRDNVIAERDATILGQDKVIAERDDAIARLTAHVLAGHKIIADYEKLLSETQSQLSRRIEVSNWMYASRSWRVSNALRRLDRLSERWSSNRGLFHGALDSPQSVVTGFIEIRGWVYSPAAPVILVEAFLDDFYLGSVHYGEERPDIVADASPTAPLQCGYKDRIELHGLSLQGEKKLRIRVYDAKGNKQVYTRPVIIATPSSTDLIPPPEFFEGILEYPQPNGIISDSLEIGGWVYSKGGAVIFIEALVDDSYLGRVFYGEERPDVVKEFPSAAPLRCGYRKSFLLNEEKLKGQRTLKIRVYDENGNTQTVDRRIKLEFPTAGAVREAQARANRERDSAKPQEMPAALSDDLRQSTGLEIVSGPRSASAIARSLKDRLPLQLPQVISEFQTQVERDPSILDWNSGFDLRGAFPNLAVFSPPSTGIGDSVLPYLDHTIDIVVMSSSDPAATAEARRVAMVALIRTVDPESCEVEWQKTVEENSLQTTSIIIPVYNEVSYTENCLDQLRNTLPHNFRGEIILVDDASSDDTPKVLKRFADADKHIKVLRNAENAGFIASCNRAATEASGEILVFLNNDTLPRPGWLPPLLRVLRDKPDAGAVGGKLVYPDGTLQEAGAVIFSDGSGCNFGKHDKAANGPLYNFLRVVDYCSAALLATRRALFLELGGFDRRFQPAYYEDADYCFSLRERGYRVYYQPESVVVHFEGVSSGTDITAGVKSYQAVNRDKFVEKWKDTLADQPAPPTQYDSATLQDLAVSGRR